jgi:cyclic beta-1,2-glucan synthetase
VHPTQLRHWIKAFAEDPCGALRTTVVLPPNGSVKIACFLGEAASATDAGALITDCRTKDRRRVL